MLFLYCRVPRAYCTGWRLLSSHPAPKSMATCTLCSSPVWWDVYYAVVGYCILEAVHLTAILTYEVL